MKTDDLIEVLKTATKSVSQIQIPEELPKEALKWFTMGFLTHDRITKTADVMKNAFLEAPEMAKTIFNIIKK